jgi:hypothetical protein
VCVETQNWQVWATRLDRPVPPVRHHSQILQKVIWISTLDRSRRVDQDPYIERPIRSPDERDMASGRSGRCIGRLDWGSRRFDRVRSL